MDDDYLLALRLQEEFDREANLNSKKNYNDAESTDSDDDNLNKTQNIVHPEWETLDPTPDVKALFFAFDNKFFQGRLKCVELEWSKRMYSCAGICYTRKNRMGMAIVIRLSEPLLKLRSRKNLVETLLHEMIHAYCAILGIREGNGGHGPNFRKIMNGINKVAGTNITVYHNFHDEVNVYKTHWWRCNGICQNRSPFFGYVKRTSNRAPGPNDIWWRQHSESCGGSFLKIKEPDKKIKSKKEKTIQQKEDKKNSAKENIKTYFPTINLDKDSCQNKSKSENEVRLKFPPQSQQNGMFGLGYSLMMPLTPVTGTLTNENKQSDETRKKLRDIWSNKYPCTSPSSSSNPKKSDGNDVEISTENQITEKHDGNEQKKRRLTIDDYDEDKNNEWTMVDEEIMVRENNDSVINISSDSSDEDDSNNKNHNDDNKKASVNKSDNIVKTKQSSEDRQNEIKKEILETSITLDENDIVELIDDEFDDVLNNSVDIANDTSLVDDLFGDDTLLKQFEHENAIVATGTRYHRDANKDIVTCPICEERTTRENLSGHLDGCIGITVKIVRTAGPSTSNNKRPTKNEQKHSVLGVSHSKNTLITGTRTISSLPSLEATEGNSGGIIDRRRGLVTSTHTCPVCAEEVDVNSINEHLDSCLEP